MLRLFYDLPLLWHSFFLGLQWHVSFPLTCPAESCNEWSWKHKPMFFLLTCHYFTAVLQPNEPMHDCSILGAHSHAPRAPSTQHRGTRACHSCSWAEAGRKATEDANMGIKGNLCMSRCASHRAFSIHCGVLLPLVWLSDIRLVYLPDYLVLCITLSTVISLIGVKNFFPIRLERSSFSVYAPSWLILLSASEIMQKEFDFSHSFRNYYICSHRNST